MFNEDAIDFPCSPAWVTHYAKRGLTPDYPDDYYRSSISDDTKELIDEAVTGIRARTEERINLLQGQIVYLQKKLEEKGW